MNFMTSADEIVGVTFGCTVIAGAVIAILINDNKAPKRPKPTTRVGRRIEDSLKLNQK